jgi:hypothetical protein
MVTSHERASDRRVLNRRRINCIRRAALGVALALAGLIAAVSPAAAAANTDGTSNTIQYAVKSAVLDQANQRVIVTAPATDGLTPGRHLATVEVVTPRLSFVLENTLISSFAGKSSSLSLNFTKIDYVGVGPAPCMRGADACLMEDDGIWLPGL